jgi:hypothetical protein
MTSRHSRDPAFDRAISAAVDRGATTAHRLVDNLADQALTGVGKVSGSLHVAANHAADAAAGATDWAAAVPTQMRRGKAMLADTTCAAIRSRPFVAFGGALVAGFILGRLIRR